MGGRYYLQHLAKCVAALPANERAELHDLYWSAAPENDPFEEVRGLIASRTINFPATLPGRITRKLRRIIGRTEGAADLFRGVDVTFPSALIANQGIPFVHWSADLQYLHNPAIYSPELLATMTEHDRAGIRDSARVAVSSEFGRRDLERFFPEASGKVDVLRFCSVADATWWSADPIHVADSKGWTFPFFAISNQFTEHKNHLACIEAVKLLRDRGVTVRVVCTGSSYDFRGRDYFGTVQRYVQENGLEDRVFFAGLLPREEQIAVLRRAIAILQPSRFEGWSTIVEDAKTLGKPLVASHIPVHREQLGGHHPWYVQPDDIERWALLMRELYASLKPGPVAGDEESGRLHESRASVECGRTFVGIMRRAVAS
jgi:glycosyltransferase involved in cell wall biosynthesis